MIVRLKLILGSYLEREGYNGFDYAPTDEHEDGDRMLIRDVPWEMFTSTCKMLKIMKRVGYRYGGREFGSKCEFNNI